MKKTLSKRKMIRYCLSDIAKGLFNGMIGNYLLYFFQPTVKSGIPNLLPQNKLLGFITVMALLTGLGKVIDAITDPWVASLSDRCTHKDGRRIPFLKYSAVPYAVSVLIIFMAPFKQGSFANAIWVGLFLIAYYTAYTFFFIPRNALVPEVIPDAKDRVGYYGISTAFFMGSSSFITVILYGGSPIELPFADKVDAILNMYLPGQNGGEATYSLLFGESTPSGKLAQTWPCEYADVPFCDAFGKTQNEVYKESVFVGYRYYTTAGKKVRYPFGYGLSYTSFRYENMSVQETENGYLVSCDVTNMGAYDGAEVVQLYVGAPAAEVFCPVRELKGFSKVYLKAGETQRVEIAVEKNDLRYWNLSDNRYVLEDGEYRFELCSDCQTVRLSLAVSIAGESASNPYTDTVLEIYKNASLDKVTDDVFEQMAGLKIPEIPPKKPIRMESRFSDMKATFMGKILYTAVLSVAKADMRKAKKMPEGVERDNKIKGAIFLERILDSNSISNSLNIF